MDTSRSIKVRVKVMDEEGKYALQEIHGLKEGDVVNGKTNGEAVEISWNGQTALLWLGSNCQEVKMTAKKKHVRKLPKGFMLDICVFVEDENGMTGSGATMKEAKEYLYGKIVNKYWIVKDWNKENENHGVAFGEGETREEAVEDFWYNYKNI